MPKYEQVKCLIMNNKNNNFSIEKNFGHSLMRL